MRNIIIAIISVVFFIITLTTILKFMGIEIEIFIIYVLWMIALLLFYIFLPKHQSLIFAPK